MLQLVHPLLLYPYYPANITRTFGRPIAICLCRQPASCRTRKQALSQICHFRTWRDSLAQLEYPESLLVDEGNKATSTRTCLVGYIILEHVHTRATSFSKPGPAKDDEAYAFAEPQRRDKMRRENSCPPLSPSASGFSQPVVSLLRCNWPMCCVLPLG
jgi:hypothetical protein